jgi:hypothetical protein
VGLGGQVSDRAQVFVGNATSNRIFLGTLERWFSNSLVLPAAAAVPGLQLDILVWQASTQLCFLGRRILVKAHALSCIKLFELLILIMKS